MLTRREWLASGSAGALLAQERRPNIVLLITDQQTISARMCCEREYRDIKNSAYLLICSDRDPEEACNKRGLSNDIALRYPSNLTFADHVNDLDAFEWCATPTQKIGIPDWLSHGV